MDSSRRIAFIASSPNGMPPVGGRAKTSLTVTAARSRTTNIRTKDFERVVALRARTETIAHHLAEFLKKTDRFAKTIVFCVDQEHASEMARALGNLNADLRAQYSDYVCRVTADEGEIGRGHLSRFQDVDTKTPDDPHDFPTSDDRR